MRTIGHTKLFAAIILLPGMLLAWPVSQVFAQQEVAEPAQVTVDELVDMVRRQDKQLEDQRKLIDEQRKLMTAQSEAIQALQMRVDQMDSSRALALTEEEQAIRARLEALEGTVAKIPERQETSTAYDASQFPGAFPIPGSSAALRIGGYVKMNVVQSLTALGIQDRFIVGSIPTRGPSGRDAEAALTAQQSRLNFELRENTQFGQLRAFMEGDFAGEGGTLRLRHAFGQFRDFLAGQTWSTFMDTEAAPEEVDFEGVNGRILARQPQVRYFPAIGEGWNLEVALEDPAADITGGDGLSQLPDFVASVRRDVPLPLTNNRWNVKFALLLRNLRARWDLNPDIKEEAIGWGVNMTGRTPFTRWDPRDNFTFQLSFGEGYGRYVSDLGTVGGQDAVFNDATGDMELLPVFATYGAFQKWWRDGLRSTFIASFVDIDNPDFQSDDAYANTQRVSGNLIWSPTARVDLGGELMWGRREDKDGASGTASQFQLTMRYRFQ